MKDIMEIVRSLEDSSLLIKVIRAVDGVMGSFALDSKTDRFYKLILT